MNNEIIYEHGSLIYKETPYGENDSKTFCMDTSDEAEVKGEQMLVDGITSELTQEQKDNVLSIVQQIASLKYDKYTDRKISEGFEYDNHRFSMSIQAQQNWSTLLTLNIAGLLPFPYPVTSKEGEYLFETAEAYGQFAMVAVTSVSTFVRQGRDIRKQIKAETSVSKIIEIVQPYEDYVENYIEL